MKKKKTFKRILFVLIILGFLFLHFYVPRIITEIKNPLVLAIKGHYVKTNEPNFCLESSVAIFLVVEAFWRVSVDNL